MEYLKVVHLKSGLKSFGYNDGLFAIQKEIEGILYLWKIQDGRLLIYDSGKPNITCTSANNKDVHTTDLLIPKPL